MSQAPRAHAIVSLKAYGDFAIAATAIKRLSDTSRARGIEIVAARHVMELAHCLGVTARVVCIDGNDQPDVPAIFNIREAGPPAALRSLWALRAGLSRLDCADALVFDRLGWRERILARGFAQRELPRGVNNIYLAYESFFTSLGSGVSFSRSPVRCKPTTAVIVPGARASKRVLPKRVIAEAHASLAQRGIHSKVVILDGDCIDLPSGIPVQIVARGFDSLVSAIKTGDMVIGADSLASHLAFHLELPVFVFTPFKGWTNYWLPPSAYFSRAVASFQERDVFPAWLDKNV